MTMDPASTTAGHRMVTAVHEAGHAWAYRLNQKPLRYVTVKPRRPEMSGLCQPWRPRRIKTSDYAWIASAGPIAEAIHCQQTDVQNIDGLEWDDYLLGAVLAGGHEDLRRSLGMLDNPASVAVIADMLREDWPGITALAERLMDPRTVTGVEAFHLLGGEPQ